MPLTLEQRQMIIEIDNQVNQVLLDNGDDVKIMGSFIGNLAHTTQSSIKIIDNVSPNELGWYCFKYPGFFRYLRIIDGMFERLADGKISLKKIQEMVDDALHNLRKQK